MCLVGCTDAIADFRRSCLTQISCSSICPPCLLPWLQLRKSQKVSNHKKESRICHEKGLRHVYCLAQVVLVLTPMIHRIFLSQWILQVGSAGQILMQSQEHAPQKKSVKFQDSFSFTPADGLVRGSKDLLPHGRSVPLKPVYSNSPMAKYMRLGLS